MSILTYKANAGEVVERLRALYERRAPDRIFAAFSVPGAGREALETFRKKYSDGPCDYPAPDERIEFWDQFWRGRPPLEDDSLPKAYLYEMDMGLWGGLFGAETVFICDVQGGNISSNAKPVLKDWSEFGRLSFDRTHPWFQRYLKQLKVFAAGAKGKFGIAPICLINGFHFSWELVGPSEAYVSMSEHPALLRQAMELGFEVNTAVLDAFFENVPSFHGGTFDLCCEWLPGRTVMESVDAFSMTSVPYFEKWGRASLERIFARYDGGELHVHGNGRHQLEAVSSVRGLKAINLGDDKGFLPAFSVLDELKARVGEVPLIVGAGFKDFVDKLERRQLHGGVLYHVGGVPDVETANRCMEKVRAYRL